MLTKNQDTHWGQVRFSAQPSGRNGLQLTLPTTIALGAALGGHGREVGRLELLFPPIDTRMLDSRARSVFVVDSRARACRALRRHGWPRQGGSKHQGGSLGDLTPVLVAGRNALGSRER